MEGERVPFRLGFVHLLRKNAPSLIKSRGMSSSCFTWSDMTGIAQHKIGKRSDVVVAARFLGLKLFRV